MPFLKDGKQNFLRQELALKIILVDERLLRQHYAASVSLEECFVRNYDQMRTRVLYSLQDDLRQKIVCFRLGSDLSAAACGVTFGLQTRSFVFLHMRFPVRFFLFFKRICMQPHSSHDGTAESLT